VPDYLISIDLEGFVGQECPTYPDKLHFGNLLKEGFNSIWNSPEYKEFRRAYPKKTPRFCKLCKGLSTEEVTTSVKTTSTSSVRV